MELPYPKIVRKIQTLVNKFQNANTYSVNYNASNLANGIYLYKLQTDDGYSEMKKMIIIK
ncbi:T9SS type A sorting domain-containing protein [candidate division KSB1 bacterium]|nr:T9SS type A sorting domain-containing protein [candidate division KSB1 bacterium]